jgi:hypothetical protein
LWGAYDAHSSSESGVYCPVGCSVEEFEEGAGEDDEVADCESDPVLRRGKWRGGGQQAGSATQKVAEGKGRCTSIFTATIHPNKICRKLKAPETMEAHVVSAEAANTNCSRRRTRGWFFSARRVRRGKKMSNMSDIIDALCMVEPNKMRRKNMGVTHSSFEEWLPVPCKGRLEFCVSKIHSNMSRIRRGVRRTVHTL